MNFLARILVLIGFCLGTLGAAGFHSPKLSATSIPTVDPTAPEGTPPVEPDAALLESKQEKGAPWYFGAGLGLLLLGGGYLKFAGKTTSVAGAGAQEGRADLKRRIQEVHSELVQLSMSARDLSPVQMRGVINDLNEGALYELTSEFERWTQLLGFEDYARIWAHVATGERLTNRAWTLYADGFPLEGREELLLASQAFEEAWTQA
ncbi:MAG TPA: hypothetical protein P5218_03090 [Planctomycetota bacterium]|nr:hypothetical protein [Planctomycetota bacterium]HRV80390.1 hypothetical protein [Planctomycetota bacterium]